MVLKQVLDREICSMFAESYSILSWLYIYTTSFSSIRVTVTSQLLTLPVYVPRGSLDTS